MAINKSAKRFDIFCREYVVDLNGTRAAIAAGYQANSAQQQATDLLSKPLIKKK